MKIRICLLPLLLLTACAQPKEQPLMLATKEAAFEEGYFRTVDGATLPLQQWLPKDKPRAVVLALHGFNNYHHAFESNGKYLSEQGIAVYAYDQRGFGQAPQPGIWGGVPNLQRDVREAVRILDTIHEGTPIYLLGESMGSAVAIEACYQDGCPQADGIIMAAPALWGEQTLNVLYRGTLWTMVQLFPGSEFTGEDAGVMASDNIEMLRAMYRDPLVIKKTRVDSVYGLVHLMGNAYSHISAVKLPILVLYGAHDEVIPPGPVRSAIATITAPHRVAYYPDGYHMLLRDLRGEIVWRDIAAWTEDHGKPLPSGYDKDWQSRFGD